MPGDGSTFQESIVGITLVSRSRYGPYSQEYGAVMAGSFMGTLPITIIFLIFQRRLTERIMVGALKG
jgi:ABC-type glycerol-3-phosphate transport system permease component